MRQRLFASGVWLGVVAFAGGCTLGAPWEEGDPRARIETTLGVFVIELSEADAPLTVQNFRQYAEEGFYDDTLFHRVAPGFVIQGGGFLPGLEEKPTRDPIANEGQNGLRNVRGSVAMARTDDPDSATAQFFVNLVDNPALDATLTSPGYAVFGHVIEGLDIVDAIGAVPTEDRDGFTDVPAEDVVILRATIEPGVPVLTPAWETYLEDYRFSALSGVRDVFVSILSALIGG